MNKIAVVILNWNGTKLLQQFLPSVIQYSENATIYVADNASTDESIEVLKSDFPTVKIIQNSANFGFAKGYNEALQFVEEPYFALVNSDIEVTENWLNPIIKLFDNEPTTAIIQPKILDFKKKTHFEYAGAAGGFIDKFGYPYCRGRIFETVEEDKGQYNDEIEIFWATGACLFIRKNVFEELNGFDADFFAHQEEIDLCWRAFNLGYITKYTSKSVVYHVGGATLNVANPIKTYLNFRNSLYMLVKNLPFVKLFFIITFRMILDGIAAFKFLFQGKIFHFMAVINAHFSFYGNFIKFYKKRAKNNNSNYFKTRSIVYKYFIKGQKIFNT
jgi:GT2 family glycosyltransferase